MELVNIAEWRYGSVNDPHNLADPDFERRPPQMISPSCPPRTLDQPCIFQLNMLKDGGECLEKSFGAVLNVEVLDMVTDGQSLLLNDLRLLG